VYGLLLLALRKFNTWLLAVAEVAVHLMVLEVAVLADSVQLQVCL
jgi:hypothetical protein